MGRWIVVAAFSVLAVLDAAGWAGARRSSIPRNAAFGIRTPRTLSSDASWAAGQRSGWRMRVVLPVFYLTGALWLALAGPHGFLHRHVVATVLTASAVGMVVSAASVAAARRAALIEDGDARGR